MSQQNPAAQDPQLALHRGPYSKTQARIDKLSAYPECEIVDGMMVNCLCCGISIALDVREKALKKGGYYTYNWEKHIRQTSHSKALRAWNRKQRSMDMTENEDTRAGTPIFDCTESRSQSVSVSYLPWVCASKFQSRPHRQRKTKHAWTLLTLSFRWLLHACLYQRLLWLIPHGACRCRSQYPKLLHFPFHLTAFRLCNLTFQSSFHG